MRLAIMQPYFLPYIGYYQLIAAVDTFIIYDNIKYTKKGWINRNRMLMNGSETTFTLPLKKDSDYLNIDQRQLAANFNREKLFSQFKIAYSRAPYLAQTINLIDNIVYCEESNLFRYIHQSIVKICSHLEIETDIRISSEININNALKGQDKVLALCQSAGATTYINAIGGIELYSREEFKAQGIELKFIKSKPLEYPQFDDKFIPWLSIIDVLMFNPLNTVRACINNNYDLL